MTSEMDQLREDHSRIIELFEKSFSLRKWMFYGIMLVLIAIVVTQCTSISLLNEIRHFSEETRQKTFQNEAKIDAAIQQMLIYQQQTVQRWDALSSNNPKINVPRASINPPDQRVKPLTKEELTRSPSPSPTPKPKAIVKYRYRPTPTPFKWFWQN